MIYGYHKDCGGTVRDFKIGDYKYKKCNKCQALSIHQTNILEQSNIEKVRAKTSGIKRKIIRRYDYKNWKDV